MNEKRDEAAKKNHDRERLAICVAAILITMFVVAYLASILLVFLQPDRVEQITLEHWLITLSPIVTVIIHWILQTDKKSSEEE